MLATARSSVDNGRPAVTNWLGNIVTGTDYLVGGRYQVGDRIGVGGMSEVHRARDLRLGGDVAIKVLRADLADDPAFQARFRREAQNAASLNHPAIVAVFDTGETAGEAHSVPYIVMEFVDGETLRDVLSREGPLPRGGRWKSSRTSAPRWTSRIDTASCTGMSSRPTS